MLFRVFLRRVRASDTLEEYCSSGMVTILSAKSIKRFGFCLRKSILGAVVFALVCLGTSHIMAQRVYLSDTCLKYSWPFAQAYRLRLLGLLL